MTDKKDVRQELREQEKRYRDAEIGHLAKRDKAHDSSQNFRAAFEWRTAAYYGGKADGIREALKAYEGRL